MWKTLIFWFQRLTSSKYKLSGKCKKCGNCCKTITFFIGKRPITDENEFFRMQEFDKKYKNFEINGKNENGTLLFKCKSLNDNGKCKSYHFRSLNCRLYPRINQKFVHDGGKPLDGCGYKFIKSKKFIEFIK